MPERPLARPLVRLLERQSKSPGWRGATVASRAVRAANQVWTRLLGAALAGAILAAGAVAGAADAPDIELILKYQPARPYVDCDVPTKEELPQCEVRVERRGDLSGWLVLGAQGQVLRRFLDTNNDDIVDQWRYFRNGMEVYRDLDTDADQKIDQSRFVNHGGSRWSIDNNEDGVVDSWKILSAEEASQVAVLAILDRDPQLLASVLITQEEIAQLEIDKKAAAKILESVAHPADQLSRVVEGSHVFAPTSKWIKLDTSVPGLIPADAGKASQDIFVRENSVAILDVQGETGLAQVGEIVRIGKVWKLTQIPMPIEGQDMRIAGSGLLMRPVAQAEQAPPQGISDDMRKLLEALEQLDANAPEPSDPLEAFAKYNGKRAGILAGLIEAAKKPDAKEMWIKQFAASVSAAIAQGVYPEGLTKLKAVEKRLAEQDADSTLQAFVGYRRLVAEYYKRLGEADTDEQMNVQKWWTEQLQTFVKTFPSSPDAAEALLQLAFSNEIRGNLEAAGKWYRQLVKQHPDSPPATQAKGALYRLSLKGKPFELTASRLGGQGEISAADYGGKTLLVLFWSTSCGPCQENRPKLKALYEKYHPQGFEILGINLDPNAQAAAAYLKKNEVPWPQVYEAGGMRSEPARRFGIITQPTMILVGRDGKVVSRGISVEDLQEALPDLMKRKK